MDFSELECIQETLVLKTTVSGLFLICQMLNEYEIRFFIKFLLNLILSWV